ncbi:MAG: hypothetical protein ABIH17_00980, partial [Pseudomonadota bacterium]
MLCQKCHKNLASVRYAEVVDGRVTDQQLCAECLADHQQDAGRGFEFAGPAPVLRRPSAEKLANEVLRTQRACPTCGASLGHVIENGEVGCSRCYLSFGEQIDPILKGLHRALGHKGKVARLDDA